MSVLPSHHPSSPHATQNQPTRQAPWTYSIHIYTHRSEIPIQALTTTPIRLTVNSSTLTPLPSDITFMRTGQHPEVASTFWSHPTHHERYARLIASLQETIDDEICGKIGISISCDNGTHQSVTMAERLARDCGIDQSEVWVEIKHFNMMDGLAFMRRQAERREKNGEGSIEMQRVRMGLRWKEDNTGIWEKGSAEEKVDYDVSKHDEVRALPEGRFYHERKVYSEVGGLHEFAEVSRRA